MFQEGMMDIHAEDETFVSKGFLLRLGSKIRALTAGGRTGPAEEIAPSHAALAASSPNGANVVAMIKPSSREKLAVAIHRHDWP
jgi:hypothetical protein